MDPPYWFESSFRGWKVQLGGLDFLVGEHCMYVGRLPGGFKHSGVKKNTNSNINNENIRVENLVTHTL